MKSVRNTCTESKAGRGERKKVKFGEMLKKTKKTAKIYVYTLVLGCSRAKFCLEDDAFFCYFNLHIGSIGNYVCLGKTQVEHGKVPLPDKKIRYCNSCYLHAVSININISSDCSCFSHYRSNKHVWVLRSTWPYSCCDLKMIFFFFFLHFCLDCC